MRLICPNCDAQYEVVDDVIPSDGRDVQCSNCGQTWFQHHPDNMPADEEDADAPDAAEVADDAPAEDEERVPTPAEPRKRELDASVADILRQEAELEAKARARASDNLESQPELGLQDGESDADRRARQARERMARLRGEPSPSETHVSEAAATAAAIGSRRDLLPDIEEINSTLRSTSDRQAGTTTEMATMDGAATTASQRSRSGFRRGFFLVVLLALVLGAIYVFAPQIAQAVPQVDPYLSSYVAFVDGLRVWLDTQVTTFLTWLDAMASSQEG